MPPIIMSQGQICEALRVSRPTIKKYESQGLPVVSRGKYDVGACVVWLINFKLSLQHDDNENTKPKDTNTPEYRMVMAKADKLDRENAEAEGKLIPAEIFESFVGFMCTTFANTMDSVGSRICNQAAASDDPAEIQAMLWEETRDARMLLADKVAELEIEDLKIDK